MVLDKMGISTKDLSYVIPVPAHAKALADEQIQKIGAPYIIINSFAGARYRSLSEDTTVAMVKHFLEKYPDHKVVSIGNFGDLHILKEWQARHAISAWVVLPQCGDIFVNCRLIEKSELVISPDTAVVHIACAFKRNLIAIYRTDTVAEKNVQIWAPYGCHHKIVLARAQPEAIDADINKFDFYELSLGWFLIVSKTC